VWVSLKLEFKHAAEAAESGRVSLAKGTILEYWLRLAKLFVVNLIVWCVVGGVLGLIIRHPILGLVVGFLGGIVYWMIGSFISDKFAPELYAAQTLEQRSAPNLYQAVEDLSKAAGIVTPMLKFIPLQAPNAFAVGRGEDSGTIVVTNGLITQLEYGEARAILALMVARIKFGDAGIYSIASALAGLPLAGLGLIGSEPSVLDSSNVVTATATWFTRLRVRCLLPYSVLILKAACSARSIARTDTYAVAVAGDAHWAMAIGKIADALPKNWWEAGAYQPATALLFAVPPLPPNDPVAAPTPGWLSAVHYFPFRVPAPEDRFITATRSLAG
jgi:Zn-dependent protease with chaperone function